jgi:hypothetical protein
MRADVVPEATAQYHCGVYSLRKAKTELSSGPTRIPESRRGWEGGIEELAKTLLSAGKNGLSGPVSSDGSPP